jgi:hypothetical protein
MIFSELDMLTPLELADGLFMIIFTVDMLTLLNLTEGL